MLIPRIHFVVLPALRSDSHNANLDSDLEEERWRRTAPALKLGLAGRQPTELPWIESRPSRDAILRGTESSRPLLNKASMHSVQSLPSAKSISQLKALFADDGSEPDPSTAQVFKRAIGIVVASLLVMVILVLALLHSEQQEEFKEIDAQPALPDHLPDEASVARLETLTNAPVMPPARTEGSLARTVATAAPLLYLPRRIKPLGTFPPELPPLLEDAIHNVFPDIQLPQTPTPDTVVFGLGDDSNDAAWIDGTGQSADQTAEPSSGSASQFSRVGLDRATTRNEIVPSEAPSVDTLANSAAAWKAQLRKATNAPVLDTLESPAPAPHPSATQTVAVHDATADLDASARHWHEQITPTSRRADHPVPISSSATQRNIPV